MFTPIREKLNTLIPDAKEIDAFNHFSTIVERMIVNGHAAHKTIPGYDKCKPEIETYKVFEGITIPVHGYADFKGKIIIEDKCKFPRRGRVKKDGTRSWSTTKLPETIEPYHLMQTDFYHYATELPIYICYINEEGFKVFSAENCELLTPKSIESRKKDFIQRCKVRQNLMKISNDVNVLKDYIQPDFENYFWRNDLDPTYLDNAKKFWSS
mgnify:FL=1|jgi:hypothetical protein|tara:strand:+ start:1769 stop:2401 length:633 start_codon:yes stop_codon:yes gene_type:complete